VRLHDREITVYHTNAIRLERGGKAAPFMAHIKPWNVDNDDVKRNTVIDIKKKLV
jgi:hypothetical protein